MIQGLLPDKFSYLARRVRATPMQSASKAKAAARTLTVCMDEWKGMADAFVVLKKSVRLDL